jgi:hypothetical protein
MTVADCFEIVSSIFRNIASTGQGGAIYQTLAQNNLYILDSTFDNCSSSVDGGAALLCSYAEVERCCFQACQCRGGSGLAVAMQSSGLRFFGGCNFCDCASETREGLISVLGGSPQCSLDRLNITETRLADGKRGAAILATVTTCRWSMSSCTIVNCTGGTVISSSVTDVNPMVEFCNFYDNLASDHLFSVTAYGLKLDHCVLNGNGQSLEFEMTNPSVANGYQLSQCVLDGDLPDPSILALSSGVETHATTDSLPLVHNSPCYYPPLSSIVATDFFSDSFVLRFRPRGRIYWCSFFLFLTGS